MKDHEYRDLKRDAKAARISVKPTKYSPTNSQGVPTHHKDIFEIIQSLGRTSFSTYRSSDTVEKPWKLANIIRAKKLVHFASKCRKENRNEAGWRNEVESKVFERFDIEVACKACGKRLWRSEIEANPTSSNSKTRSLESRQQRREQCKCNTLGRLDDYLDPRISEVFSSRLQETVCEPGEPGRHSSDPKQIKKQPDRIHGLQQTSNFEKLFEEPYAHDKPQRSPRKIGKVVNSSVTPDNGGDPLLFPFLILEAKRERGAQNFEQMETQTAFPIKSLLKLQYDLMKTPGNTMDVPGGPLVWFFASRGEDWRVYGAVVKEEEGTPTYIINYLWGGSVTGYDEALQLILIEDYVLDWARDIYRPDILRQLTSLHSLAFSDLDDAMTCIIDPDIYSVQGEVQPWMEAQDTVIQLEDALDPNSSDVVSVNLEDEQADSLEQFKCPYGLVRDARIIESRLRALYITRDNAQTLFQGFENPRTATILIRSILTTLSRRCVELESQDVLNAIEDKWTGNVRLRSSFQPEKPRIYVQFRVSYFISHTWEQVRELTYLAVSEDARELLVQRAKFRGVVRRSRFNPPKCLEGEILGTIDKFLKRSVRQDFLAALKRRTYMVNVETQSAICSNGLAATPGTMSPKMVSKQDKDQKSPGVSMHDIVDRVYQKYRIGNRDPSEPFLRISARVDRDGRPLWKNWQPGDLLPIKEIYYEKMLVYGDMRNTRGLPASEQKLCMYILDGQTELIEYFPLVARLLRHVHEGLIYATVLKGRPTWTGKKGQDNRDQYRFEIEEAEEKLKLSREGFRQSIFDWIRSMTPRVMEDASTEELSMDRILQDVMRCRMERLMASCRENAEQQMPVEGEDEL